MRENFNGIPATELRSADGAVALIADHGAHLLSWTPAGGEPVLYLSDKSQYGGASAIRGGVPIIFPQFGERGSGKRHGFARVQEWTCQFAGVEDGRAVARFRLARNALAGDAWQHGFQLEYQIAFSAQQLALSLEVTNTSNDAWEFCAALHTYLRVADISGLSGGLSIIGLQGTRYLDQVAGGIFGEQAEPALQIAGEIDRIYAGVAGPLLLDDGARQIKVDKTGFQDVVVWNPGKVKAAALSDMAPLDYASFVCVEAGAILEPVVLEPGQRWSGVQTISVAAQ
jgi:glucose-6-phosphate 1-epimerase